MATLTCSPNGNLYYLKHDYVWFNDTVELFQYQNNISKKLYTMTGQLGQTKSIYAFNNDVLIASFSQAAPFKSELYRLVEKKPITADFSYTIQNMTVQFTKLDTACKDFIWDFGNGNTSTINPNPIVTYQSPGTYSPCLKCGTDPAICAVITVPCNNCSGTTTNVENNANVKIKLFPNPTNGLVYFDGLTPSKKINVNIYSIQSKLISSFEIEDSGYIDISGYEQGIYLISIEKIGMYKVLKY